jgi:hypothetical protein
MVCFAPSTKRIKTLKSLQTELGRLGSALERLDDAEKSWLHRCAMICTIGASTRIENAVLTDAEIEWVDTTLSRDGHVTSFDLHKAAIIPIPSNRLHL